MKYPKPKILAIDVEDKSVSALSTAGYNVSAGSFGTPYEVEVSNGAHVVSLDSVDLPDLNEQEVLLIDLDGADFGTAPRPKVANHIYYLWQPDSVGVITPRPVAIAEHRNQFDKVFGHAGLCIVFADTRQALPYFRAKMGGTQLYDELPIQMYDNWSLLEELVRTEVSNESGREIIFEDYPLAQLIRRGGGDAEYHCSFKIHVNQIDRWMPIAKNKYGNTVAGLHLQPRAKRFLLLLPQMPEFYRIAVELIEHFIATWRPDLFPYLEGAKWVHRPEYEIPKITAIQTQIEQVAREAEKRVESLQTEIEGLQKANADSYTLLNGSGDELVQAVIRSLTKLGFHSVIDVDVEEKKQGNVNSLREDIQIHDNRPILIVDVKGINDCPSDDESTQAAKHALMRMTEWKHTEVKPLTIVNHQRHIPPRDRNPNVYRPEIIGNAERQHLGLMTTWDLFQILRNMTKLGWTADVVMPIFYRTGRIEPIPEHYRKIGVIVDIWDKALGIVPTDVVRVGDRLAIEAGESFEELVINSIMINGVPVSEGGVGANCGIRADNASNRFRKKARVFKVAAPA